MPSHEAQSNIDNLVDKELDPAIKGGLSSLINWMTKYAKATDILDINPRPDDVRTKLLLAGYKIDECTGPDFVAEDKNIVGRYLIGQVLAMLSKNSGILNPFVVEKFASDYNALPDKIKSPARPAPQIRPR